MEIPETRELLLAGLYPILDDDPFALTGVERRELAASMRAEQAAWRALLERASGDCLAEEFPAFLLATPPFASTAASVRRLARRCGQTPDRSRPDQSRMERFVADFRAWLLPARRRVS